MEEVDKKRIENMSTKRVILANDSRLLCEALQRVIDKSERLEALQEPSNHEALTAAIERLDPDWVIVSSYTNKNGYTRIDSYPGVYPTVGFIFLYPELHTVKLKQQTIYEEDLTNLSVNDFIQLLENDLEQI